MKEIDYIVVGCGLASIAFCEELRANNKSFIVFDNNSQKSSLVAAGLYNPVILKRFSAVWKAKEQLEIALPHYAKIERELDIKIDYKLKIQRRFASIEEQNLWFNAMDKPNVEPYLSDQLIKNSNDFINAPFGFGEVLGAGRIDTDTLITSYKEFLNSIGNLREEDFLHAELKNASNIITYKNLLAKHVVFAEGFGVKKNLYFKEIPINGTKGEVLTVKAPSLKIDFAIKSSVFIIPLGNDNYIVGSTYNRKDKTNTITEEGKNEILSKLKTFVSSDVEVIEHVAAVRPTVIDRRPVVGTHSTFKNIHILNGLGSRGVMVAPYVAKKLYNVIENNLALDCEIDVKRFSKN
ncbi:NAD(P)/FAD-dependent oxidoreductase [Winogradskyella endarachnes]|uniref:FAD-dependent oxidoreductase n=1 Tax=Winogradskyella endarachnes TaxID=2681965 RepID=A0A6L6U7M9_9FLAO|nr:FAD-dependent oxidoreductase [Winogradskyella endarachnes]MUU78009.1 FAD-dependent oxidoreductase [Winogradskyella endarachnes]